MKCILYAYTWPPGLLHRGTTLQLPNSFQVGELRAVDGVRAMKFELVLKGIPHVLCIEIHSRRSESNASARNTSHSHWGTVREAEELTFSARFARCLCFLRLYRRIQHAAVSRDSHMISILNTRRLIIGLGSEEILRAI